MNDATKSFIQKEEKEIKGFFNDFKAFINKGNVVDLAVAVVIGGAFGKIVTSIVAGIITPLIGLVTGGVDLADKTYVLKAAEGDKPELVLKYGETLQASIDFIIIAFAIFIMLRVLIKMRLKEAEQPAPAPAKSPELEVLENIRDLLKKNDQQ